MEAESATMGQPWVMGIKDWSWSISLAWPLGVLFVFPVCTIFNDMQYFFLAFVFFVGALELCPDGFP